jgi:dipeptide/tripeptide permease
VMVAAGVALAGALADQVGVSWTLAAATIWVAVGLLVAVAGRGRLAQSAAVAGPAHALTGDGDSPQQYPPP